jgi:chemosensory pili system protein ChpA (sensor histidine kinase/response regulator)
MSHGFDASTKGMIQIDLSMRGMYLQIRYQDNGQGMNMQKIRQLAARRVHDVSEHSDSEIAQLIFDSGFSTRDQVDEFAGRGIGMDVVRSSLQEIGGSIHVALDSSLQEVHKTGFSPLSFKILLPTEVFLGVQDGVRKVA